MTYATALALPSWTAEVQSHSKAIIRYTPIVFQAFNKTLAPVIIASLKGASLYFIQRERLWYQWAMSAAGITHNPIQAACASAHAELASADAKATYSRVRHITREAAMDALVVGLCGVVAVATTIETAQAIYRHAVAFYGKAQARFKPAPVIVPTVELAFAAAPDEAIAAIIEDIRVERYFTAQFDQLDSDVQLIMEEEVDEAIAQVAIAQLKSARAALALQTEGDLLAREALAFVVDRAIVFAKVKPQPIAEVAVVDELAASLEVPGATGTQRRQRKASTSKATEAKPKRTRAKAGAGAK